LGQDSGLDWVLFYELGWANFIFLLPFSSFISSSPSPLFISSSSVGSELHFPPFSSSSSPFSPFQALLGQYGPD